jgi:hypothetical protein
MAEDNRTAKAAVTISAGAAITAALALLTGKSKAAQNGTIPDELLQLVISIAQSADNIDTDMDTLISKLGDAGISVQGYPKNCNGIQSVRVFCTVVGQVYQLPSMDIPDGFPLMLKAWPLNTGLIYIGEDQSAANNPNRVTALNRSETTSIYVTNAKYIWVSGTFAGDSVSLLAEKRKAV